MGEEKAKVKREGISMQGRFSEKHLEASGSLCVCVYVFALNHIVLSKGCPFERSHGVNQEHLLGKEGI